MIKKLIKLAKPIAKRYLFLAKHNSGDFSGGSLVIPAQLEDSAKDTIYRIGIVGFGAQGKAIYKGISTLGGTEVTQICDTREESFAQVAANNNKVACFTDLNDFVDQGSNLDLVIIATTAPLHLVLLKQVLAKNTYKVLIEKPLDNSLTRALEIEKELSDSDKDRIYVNYSKRHLPDFKNMKNIFREESIGKIRSIQITIGKAELAMIVSHYFDLLAYWLGCYPEKVQACLEEPIDNVRGNQYVDHYGLCTLFYPEGITVQINFSSNHSSKNVKLLVQGEKGYSFFDEQEGFLILQPDGMKPFVFNSLEQGTSAIGIQRVLVDVLSAKEKVKCSFENALYAMKVIYACHYSNINAHRLVDVDGELEEYSNQLALTYP